MLVNKGIGIVELMKILHLESSPGWGGQEIRSHREAIGMEERGHTSFFAVEKNGGLVKRAREDKFKVYEIKFKKIFWFSTLFNLVKIIVKNKIDVINTHSSNDAWIGGIAARITRRKVIRTRHLSTPIRPGLNSYFLYNYLADYVVTTCKAIVDTICKQSKKERGLCSSIPTGVDFKNICYDECEVKEFRKKWQLKETDFLVGTVCFMRSWKGIDDFLDAAKMLSSEKELKWVIIGGGHAKKYQDRAKKLGLENIVYFSGHLESPFPAIAALDAFVLLSTAHEGVSQASLQAAFLKKPIIGTTTGGIREVCIDNETGISVSTVSPKEVKDAAMKLKNNPHLCRSMGEKAKQLVLNNFTYKEMLDRMEEVYCIVHGKINKNR